MLNLNKKFLPFYFITISVFIIALMDEFFTEGMFADGVVYSAIARNIADGLGSFWKPFYTQNWSGFFEHPPLAFYLQSFIYRIFGDKIILDSVYSMLTALAALLIMNIIWNVLMERKNEYSLKLKQLFFIPAFIWIITPTNSWGYRHNLLENTMSLFTLLGVLFSILASKSDKRKTFYLFGILSGLCIFCAFITKGPVGLFPMATPIIFWLIYQTDIKKALLLSMLNIIVFLGTFLIIFKLNNEAIIGFGNYFYRQIISGVSGQGKVVPVGIGRFYILQELLKDGIPVVLATSFLALVFARKKVIESWKIYKSEILFLLLVGISASFPIMLSLKQSGFYAIPSIPFYILSGGIITASACINLHNIKNNKIFLNISAVLMITAFLFVYSKKGQISRDFEILPDVKQIVANIPKHSQISLQSDKIFDKVNMDELQGYFYRYAYILITKFDENSSYVLTLKNEPFEDKNFSLFLDTQNYHLYKKKDI